MLLAANYTIANVRSWYVKCNCQAGVLTAYWYFVSNYVAQMFFFSWRLTMWMLTLVTFWFEAETPHICHRLGWSSCKLALTLMFYDTLRDVV